MRFAPSQYAALALILLLGAWLRLQGLDWDQGHHLHPDERFLTMVESAIDLPASPGEYFDTSRSPLNPANRGHRFFVYGTLPLFFVRAVAALTGLEDYGQVHLLGRALSALFDLGTVVLVWRIGRLVAGPVAGLLGAGLLALSVTSIQQSHFFTVDSFACFFATASVLALLRLARGGHLRDSLAFGALFGMALSCRVNLALLGVFLPAAAAHAFWRHGARLSRLTGGMVIAGVTAALMFRIAQPYAFAGPGFFDLRPAGEFLESMQTIRGYVTGDAESPPSVQWIGRAPILFPAKNVLFWGLGPACGVAAVLGLGWCLFRRSRVSHDDETGLGRIAAGWTALLFLYHGIQFGMTGRYFLPIVPMLAVLAAAWLVSLAPRPRLFKLVTAIILVATAFWAFSFTAIYRRPHSRVEASRWIFANISAGDTIAIEHWDDGVPMGVDGRAPSEFQFVELGLYAEDDVTKRKLLANQLDQTDWIVLSSNRLYRSIPRTPWRYPLGRRYYELLFSGELGFRLEKAVTSYPRLGPIEIVDDEAEEAFTVYDHPKVLIFRKTPAFTRERVEALFAAVPLTGIVRVPPRDASALYRKMRPADIPLPGEEQARSAVAASAGGVFGESWTVLVRWLLAFHLLWAASFVLLARGFAGPSNPARGFARLPDRGLGFAAFLAWLGPGYLGWLAASLGVAKSSDGLFRGLALALLAAGATLAIRRRALLRSLFLSWESVRLEAIFLVAFGLAILFRALDPAIYWGEKPMDFAILNACLRASWMPPPDPWYAGEALNYYYFGHAMVAAFARIAGVAPAFAFNLAIATVAGLLSIGAYLAGRTLGGRAACGVLTTVAVAALGNLEGLWLWAFRPDRAIGFDYFWATSRVIEGTINEYPFWSLVFADLHAHVLALPLEAALFFLGALWLRSPQDRPNALVLGLLVAWLAGAVAVTSTWGLPVVFATQLGFLLSAWWRGSRRLGSLAARVTGWLAILALSRLLFLPFWLSFTPATIGWGWETNLAPASGVLRIFGVFLAVLVVPALILAARSGRRTLYAALPAILLAILLGTLTRSPAAGLYLGLAGVGLTLWARAATPEIAGAAMLLFTAGGVGAATEWIYVADRMNTVFKFYLEIWLLLGAAAALLLGSVAAEPGRIRRWLTVSVATTAAAAGLFTSVTGAIGSIRQPHADSPTPTLDGMAYLERLRPAELAAYRWLNREVRGTPVLLEAHGPSYQEFTRVAMNTGLPTVLGWDWHLQQQNHSLAAIAERKDDVREIYATTDATLANRLLRKYHVDLVFVGHLERKTYPPAGLAKLSGLLETVFQSAGVTIYARPGALAAARTWIEPVRQEQVPAAARPAPIGRLSEPRDVALAPDGTLWVADFGNKRVQQFSADGKGIAAHGTAGDAPGEFRDPCGVAVDGDGQIFVADTWNHRVQVLSAKGEPLAEWQSGFYGPRGIAVSAEGTVYVADSGNHRIVALDLDGEPIAVFGKADGEEGLRHPVGIAVDRDGNVYVADTGNDRIVVFDESGSRLRDFRPSGWGDRKLAEFFLDVGPDGTIWVTDPPQNQVLLFDPEGKPLGVAATDQALTTPMGITVLDAGRAAVTNAGAGSIVIVRRPGPFGADRPAPTPGS